MGRTITGAVVSLDGYIAREDDDVGPLFDWYGNGDVEWRWSKDRLTSSSSSASQARPAGPGGLSRSGCARRQAATQLPNVPSPIPKSRATSATGRPVSITICTASALNCGLNFRRRADTDASSQSRGPVQDQ
jgi:hypothetical protein